jgi:hypothetical protein
VQTSIERAGGDVHSLPVMTSQLVKEDKLSSGGSCVKKPLDEIANTLQHLQLPTLTRPDIGPNDPPTLALVQFDLESYAYSSVAYMRDLLKGLRVLFSAKSGAASDIVIRGLYEWTMQASYVDQQNRALISAGNYDECRRTMGSILTGNFWVNKHGSKYYPLEDAGIPDGVRIKHWTKAYRAHQMETRGEDRVEDDYGYLSEHAHPSSACFYDFRRIRGLTMEFVEPKFEERPRGMAQATVIDWSLCICNILGLARETVVRNEFVAMLERLVQ